MQFWKIQQQTFLREGNKMDSIDDHFLNESFPIDSSSEFATIATFLRLIQLKKCHIIFFFIWEGMKNFSINVPLNANDYISWSCEFNGITTF